MSRFAIISDIHGNMQALEAVLADVAVAGCTQIVCLGDIVGYNANPSECLEAIRGLNCPVVRGNHDECVADESPLSNMNPKAAMALRWARTQLSEEQKHWLRRLRLMRNVSPFTIVHSTLDQPSYWRYIINKFDATSNFSFQITKLCFHGHTHVPKYFVYDKGIVTEYLAEDFSPDGSLKYFINVGSVGQPRDGDPRACYVIYDSYYNAIYFRRVPYDIGAAQQAILDAGLDEFLAARLASGS